MEKQALVVGINYTGTPSALSGCINDANAMGEKLTAKGYKCEIMTDGVIQGSPHGLPTRKGILQAFLDLILSGKQELFFHYSGHGSQVVDENGDERDGMDETIVPLDYTTNGMITDDELRGIICCLRNQRLVMVLDCCHSGTGMDGPYNLYKSYVGNNYFMYKDPSKTETVGEVVMISGCLDNQTSADAYISGKYQGALTNSLLKFMEIENLSWSGLVENVRKDLKDNGYEQIPNLTSGRWIDVNNSGMFRT
jgi:hypothetical protein